MDINFINVDLRYACVYRYFTFDVACGLGIPTQFNNTFVQMMKESCLHAGLTTHIGNNYTNSLFLQMGMFNAPITSFASKQILSDTYFLIDKSVYEKYGVEYNPYYTGSPSTGDTAGERVAVIGAVSLACIIPTAFLMRRRRRRETI